MWRTKIQLIYLFNGQQSVITDSAVDTFFFHWKSLQLNFPNSIQVSLLCFWFSIQIITFYRLLWCASLYMGVVVRFKYTEFFSLLWAFVLSFCCRLSAALASLFPVSITSCTVRESTSSTYFSPEISLRFNTSAMVTLFLNFCLVPNE